eukprot:TRINITY_DN2434_c0_g1_i2.p1 TRINITY_DN2434_c0_g1~~TRINITY_DN2434_c0_g1_i2.p1  ORF type:complete len:521 (+),score=158.72 TRINITY_DN2434_c0_g1_i2:134-1564(+)
MPGGCLLKLYIFNNTVSAKEETQHENLMYYHPAGLTLDEKLMDIGLSGSVVGFHDQFEEASSISSLCCEAYQLVWIEPEPEFWICATLRRQPPNPGDPFTSMEDHEAKAVTALLKEGYRFFRLHHGDFTQHYKSTLPELRRRLTAFWDIYIQWMTPLVAQGLDLFDCMGGIKYLPADRAAYLKVQSLVHALEVDFPAIRASLVLVDGLLLYTGLNLEDTHTMFQFLSMRQRSGSKPQPFDNVIHLSHPSARGDESYVGFLSPTQGCVDTGRAGLVRQIISERVLGRKAQVDQPPINMHLGPFHATETGTELTRHSLVVYQCGRYILGMFIDPEVVGMQSQPEVCGALYRELNSALSRFSKSTSQVTDNIVKSIVWDENYQYVYFNRMNMALKSSLRRKGADAQEALRHIERLHRIFEDYPNMKEAWARSKESTWVVGRKSGSRDFYSVFDGKSSLSDAHEEVKRVSQVFFNGMFID